MTTGPGGSAVGRRSPDAGRGRAPRRPRARRRRRRRRRWGRPGRLPVASTTWAVGRRRQVGGGRPRRPSSMVDAQPLALGGQPVGDGGQPMAAGARGRDPHHPARSRRPGRPRVTRWPRPAATRAHSSPATPAPDDEHVDADGRRGRVGIGLGGLVAGAGLDHAASRSGCGRRAPCRSGCTGCRAGCARAGRPRPWPPGRGRRSGPGSSPRRRSGRRRWPTRPGRRRRSSPGRTPGPDRPTAAADLAGEVEVEAGLRRGRRVGWPAPRRCRRAPRPGSRPTAPAATAISAAASGTIPAHGASSSHDRRRPDDAARRRRPARRAAPRGRSAAGRCRSRRRAGWSARTGTGAPGCSARR